MTHFMLVHGAFCGGWVWADVAEKLKKAGHEVVVVDQLPSGGTDPSSLGDLAADSKHVRSMLDACGEPIVLVAHSYGGMVITEVADHPNVRHSVYVAAFFPQKGQSLRGIRGGPAPWNVRRDDGALETTEDFELLRDSLCADLDRDRTRELFGRMALQSAASFAAPSSAPDKRHPTTYLIAEWESDNCIPVALQEAMSMNADHVVRLPAAHMVQVSCSYELAGVLGRI